MPHSPMIEKGIHAITLEAVFSKQVNKESDTLSIQNERVVHTIALMERMVRTFDQVDEQLHAGYFFFILSSNTRFVSNSVFIYPAVIILFSFAIPAYLDYIQYHEQTDT